MEIKDIVQKAHDNAVKHGFWDPPLPFGTAIALIHSELSEALEEERAGNPLVYYPCNAGGVCEDDRHEEGVTCGSRIYDPDHPDAPCSARSKKPEGVAVELADAVIRIADLCGHLGIDLDAVIADDGKSADVTVQYYASLGSGYQTYTAMVHIVAP